MQLTCGRAFARRCCVGSCEETGILRIATHFLLGGDDKCLIEDRLICNVFSVRHSQALLITPVPNL